MGSSQKKNKDCWCKSWFHSWMIEISMVWQEDVAVVEVVEESEESTKKLVQEALKRGSSGNITCVVVRFLDCKTANIKTTRSQPNKPIKIMLRHSVPVSWIARQRMKGWTKSRPQLEAVKTQRPRAPPSNLVKGHNTSPKNLDQSVADQKPVAAGQKASSTTHTMHFLSWKESKANRSSLGLNHKPRK